MLRSKLPRNLSKFAKSCCVAAAAAAAVFAAMPAASAFADDRGDRYHDAGRRQDFRGYDRRDDDRREHDHDRPRPSIGISIGGHSGGPVVGCPPPPPPPARVVRERVYVEPVYRTVTERKWVEPVVRTISDRKWVPDRCEWRDVVYHDHYGRRRCKQERVLVERGHFVDCPRTVEIAPGRWDTCTRQELICPGKWETCERQELVAAGYWTTREVEVAAPAPQPSRYESSHASINLRFPIGR